MTADDDYGQSDGDSSEDDDAGTYCYCVMMLVPIAIVERAALLQNIFFLNACGSRYS